MDEDIGTITRSFPTPKGPPTKADLDRAKEWAKEFDRRCELTFADAVVRDMAGRLMNKDLRVRQTAYEELRQMFGKDFGYQAESSREDRRRALNRFLEWWDSVALFYSWDQQAQKIVFVEEAKIAGVSARRWSIMTLSERMRAMQKSLGRPLTEQEFKRMEKKHHDDWGEFLEIQKQCDALRQSLGRDLTNEEINKVTEEYYKAKKDSQLESNLNQDR
jgi:hypothetical protein